MNAFGFVEYHHFIFLFMVEWISEENEYVIKGRQSVSPPTMQNLPD
jgi:hypothetical protein